MGKSPHDFLTGSSLKELSENYSGFVHRFAKSDHLVGLLWGIRQVVKKYGSLHECMMSGSKPESDTIFPGLISLVADLIKSAKHDPGHLLPLPERGSAGKRLNLFLRWMVRKDDVDPGGWEGISPSKLIIPLDVHMHRICTMMKFTQKKQANLKAALEITECFRNISPDDPVKYDFSLTRVGIQQLPVPGFIKNPVLSIKSNASGKKS